VRPITPVGPVAPLPKQAVYSISQLADAASMSRQRAMRLLRAFGVRMIRSGQMWLVPLSELELKAPPFWQSIQSLDLLRQRDE
jgi:hypothetical protein